ncbi:HoxN/HupN/NixA family nickel/cobalt transporter [Helicobacter sp. 11S02629-2]|uniref:HoxN/HupN/NixA family nickel/cobalt transporter n=1 Tax=Helicobacter sp. 11S02629-2 TaxID=1476195 RepID=UPI000BD3267A|nr:HoxN/HupN/NixA family nickel/cobalt transporter [Helicobacter sp. 11S02629-2]PAF45814.1 hypothetical protein BKH40_02135 [Helicobacter sp. 11S02629-2]
MGKLFKTPQVAGLIIFNIVMLVLAFIVFAGNWTILATCALAYSYGLRHAFDIDHITAIDNMTRKFISQNKNPRYLGLMFSMGHSTIVVVASFLLALSGLALKDKVMAFSDVGGIIGTLTSAVVLLGLGFVNLYTLKNTVHQYKECKAGKPLEVHMPYQGRSFISRAIYRLFSKIDKSYKMYIVGFLFGLGFDTATEVGLLGISFAGAQSHMSVWAIMIFPFLFVAGMTLLDTIDNLLMVGIYSWGTIGTLKRMKYNISMLSVSVTLAFVVGIMQIFNLISLFTGDDAFARTMDIVGNVMAPMGIGILILFVLIWMFFARRMRAKRAN